MWKLFASVVIGFGSCSSSLHELHDAVMLASLFILITETKVDYASDAI